MCWRSTTTLHPPASPNIRGEAKKISTEMLNAVGLTLDPAIEAYRLGLVTQLRSGSRVKIGIIGNWLTGPQAPEQTSAW